MSVLLSKATGNFLTAGTWALVDATSYLNSEAVVNQLNTGNSGTSSTFTPGAITVDAAAVKLAARLGTLGTVTVALQTGGSDVATTTINVADLPAATTTANDGGWIVFKFAAPVTLLAATAYLIRITMSGGASSVSWYSSVGSEWARMLRTTTTQAPAAGDNLVVAGEHTGAGTGNDFTVTMDQTAATDYGSNTTSTATPALAICKRGTLKFKDTSAANPYLRLSGYAIVYNGGTFNIGVTGGSEIPRDSTAILEFDCAADGDFGLVARNGSTVNLQGLSRTSGKNVVSAKLNANMAINLVQSVSAAPLNVSQAAATTTLDPTGTSLGVGSGSGSGQFNVLGGVTDTVTNASHHIAYTQAGSVTNVTQTYTHWIKRGSGTNNRFVRLMLGNNATFASMTNGFYADFDLQTPSAGTCTAVGNGTATSATITAFGGGFICTIIGKASSGALAPIASIHACNASGVVSYAGDATQNFICSWPQVYTASAQPTDLTVDTDTGWLSGDVVALASTTRTAAECEVVKLGSDAGASTLSLSLYPVNYHDGVSPVQAEVILLTRNVKVRSSLNTAMTFVQFVEGSTFDVDWTEFYYLGVNSTGKRGIEISTGTTNSLNGSIQYSSVHDTEALGVFAFSASGAQLITSFTFSNNTMWNLATATGPACQLQNAINATNYTIDNNILIRTGSGNGWTLSDVGGTFTNNTVVGAASIGLQPNEAAVLGTFSGNNSHSNAGAGWQLSVAISGTLTTLGSWRNTGAGLNISGIISDLVLDTPTMFGNTTNQITSTTSLDIILKSPLFSGDTSFATINGINVGGTGATQRYVIDNGDFSTVSGIKTAHTNDINVANSPTNFQIILRNTKLGAATEIANPSNLSNNGFIASQKHDQTAGNHMTWMRNGKVQTDSVVFNTAAPSMLMTPTSFQGPFSGFSSTSGSPTIGVGTNTNIFTSLSVGMLIECGTAAFPSGTTISSFSASAGTITASANAGATQANFTIAFARKLESAPQFQGVKVAVANGNSAGVSVYIRKSASYNGSQPRLIQKANPALGQNSDVVLATYSAGTGSWNQISGTTSTATDDGVWEIVVDCDGTAGAINVDDWATS
jgi:hypothetical protein